MEREESGYFSIVTGEASEGSLYQFRLDGGEDLLPDPASRFQPEGPRGSSEVVDPGRFAWTDTRWSGVALPGQMCYEIHVGTFTREGTWAGAARRLAELAESGITLIEVMPVADWVGRFGWGYDGVCFYAPTRNYGRPDEFRMFVNEAHARGIGVVLDVVYNHIGPGGGFLRRFSDRYVSAEHESEWGEAVNYDGKDSAPVREFFRENAAYWIDEYHLDGLRIDATQGLLDDSPRHILAEIADRARRAAGGRKIVLIGENEPQDSGLLGPESEGGSGLDALWNDDFHHSAIVALTGRNEAYYTDYLGTPQEMISAARWGFLYQGQRYTWQRKRRGRPAFDLRAESFVSYLENHDQVANSARGARLHQTTDPGRYRAMTALLLLGPWTPLLFQGQEFQASTPFYYFADHEVELANNVKLGRAEFLSQFRSYALPDVQAILPDPSDPRTFEACKLDDDERARNEPMRRMHRDLLGLRRGEAAFRAQRADRMHGAVLGPEAFVLRFFADPGGRGREDRILLVNLGRDLLLEPAPEPLLAPPDEGGWRLIWSSEEARYGGTGMVEPEMRDVGSKAVDARRYEVRRSRSWMIHGHAAAVLGPR